MDEFVIRSDREFSLESGQLEAISAEANLFFSTQDFFLRREK
jgi:hypothetical protein